MTRARSETWEQRVTALQNWLESLPEGYVLPRATDIAATLGLRGVGAYEVCTAFDRLSSRRVIRHRSGDRYRDRGHRMIYVQKTGRLYKTEGCPFKEF